METDLKLKILRNSDNLVASMIQTPKHTNVRTVKCSFCKNPIEPGQGIGWNALSSTAYICPTCAPESIDKLYTTVMDSQAYRDNYDLQMEVQKELEADMEWLSSDVIDENELLPTGQIPDTKCPKCGSPLRINNKSRYLEITDRPRQFVGCMSFPRCTYIAKNISIEVRLKMQAEKIRIENQPVEF